MAKKQALATETYDATRALLEYLAHDAPGVTTVPAFINAYDAARRKLALHVGPLAAKATPADIEKALSTATKIQGDGIRRYIKIAPAK